MAGQIKKVGMLAEIKSVFECIEDNGSEWFSNLLTTDDELIQWIGKGQVSLTATPTTAILLRQRNDCHHVFFANTERGTLSGDLRECLADLPMKSMTSILSRVGENDDIKALLQQAGFKHYATLNRVVKTTQPKVPKEHGISFARMEDLPRIMEILRRYFDCLLDQWPDEDEVIAAITNQQIIVMRLPEDNQVVAFQSFERKGKTLHGRYMASMEEYRDRAAYGPILWRQCIAMNRDVNKVIGWVQQGNDAAEKLNLALGLSFDGVTDEIFIRE